MPLQVNRGRSALEVFRDVERSQCELLAEVASRFGHRFRLKLRGEPQPEPWCPWLIAPVSSYLETGPTGPYPWRALEWVEVKPSGSDVEAVVGAFEAVGLPAEAIGSYIRVSCPP